LIFVLNIRRFDKKNAIINTEKFEKKLIENRYILVRNRLAMMIFLKIFEMVDTW